MFLTSPKKKAEKLHQEGIALDDAGETDLALKKYRQAVELDPARPTTHYNIGLIHKYRNEWAESLRYNRQAVELDPADEAANWNLAIAATALRDWPTARATWNRLGLPIEPGDTPIEFDFGITPVRLNPDDAGEVIWGDRIDPVRVRIHGIPFPSSGFRYGDVVLHDGAPVGHRLHQGREYPVFNVLELFDASPCVTYEAELHCTEPDDIAALKAICGELGLECEDWTSSVRMICRQCSEGRPHEQHDHQPEAVWQDLHRVGLAAADEQLVRQAIERWASPARRVVSVSASAGQSR